MSIEWGWTQLLQMLCILGISFKDVLFDMRQTYFAIWSYMKV